MADDHEFIGINSFLFVLLILSCLLLGGLIKRYKFTYLPESAATMIFGFICGCFLNLSTDASTDALAHTQQAHSDDSWIARPPGSPLSVALLVCLFSLCSREVRARVLT